MDFQHTPIRVAHYGVHVPMWRLKHLAPRTPLDEQPAHGRLRQGTGSGPSGRELALAEASVSDQLTDASGRELTSELQKQRSWQPSISDEKSDKKLTTYTDNGAMAVWPHNGTHKHPVLLTPISK